MKRILHDLLNILKVRITPPGFLAAVEDLKKSVGRIIRDMSADIASIRYQVSFLTTSEEAGFPFPDYDNLKDKAVELEALMQDVIAQGGKTIKDLDRWWMVLRGPRRTCAIYKSFMDHSIEVQLLQIAWRQSFHTSVEAARDELKSRIKAMEDIANSEGLYGVTEAPDRSNSAQGTNA